MPQNKSKYARNAGVTR